MPRRRVWVGVLLVASSVLPGAALAQAAGPSLEAVTKLLTEGRFADAAKAADAALAQPGTDEASVLGLYEASGIAQAQLKQAQKARVTFQKVMSLDPVHKLTGKWPPKVTAAFNEAKKSMARAGGKLAVEQLTPEIKGPQVVAVYFSIENDVLKLGKKARVHVRQDGGAWAVQEIPNGPTMKADVAGKAIEWWVELLGEHGEILAHLASQDAPIADLVPGATVPKKGDAPPPPPKKDTPPPKKDTTTKSGKTGAPLADKKTDLTPPPKESPPEVVAPAGPKSKVRVLPFALAGGGVAAAAVGAIFGVKAQGERAKITGAAVDSSGVVTGITRSQAFQLDAQARTDSAVANTLIGAGIGLVATGAVVWFLGREEASQ